MATLDDLPCKPISEMTDEELQQMIRTTRGRRVVPDKKIAAKSRKVAEGKKKAKATGATSARAILDALTPEQAQIFLEKFGTAQPDIKE